jgi:flagellar hook-basal body complex protein FliE
MIIDPISMDGASKIVTDMYVPQTTSANQMDFSKIAMTSLDSLNNNIVESNQALQDLALGKAESTHEVVIAMEKAKMSLQIAVEVRNKLVEAYQEVLRMQI